MNHDISGRDLGRSVKNNNLKGKSRSSKEVQLLIVPCKKYTFKMEKNTGKK